MTHSTIRFLTVVAVLLSACSNLPFPYQPFTNSTPDPNLGSQSISTLTPGPDQQSIQDFAGLVVDMDGKPIGGAQVESFHNTTTTDKDGQFQFSSAGLPEWIKVTIPVYISRTRAASPAVPV